MENPALSAENAIDIPENADMPMLINAFMKKLDEKDGTIRRLEQTVANLNETIRELSRRMYGRKSEKSGHMIPGQMDVYEFLGIKQEAVSPAEPQAIEVGPYTKTRKPRATHDEMFMDSVPKTTVIVELEGEGRRCPYCNTEMVQIGTTMLREEIKITPAKVERVCYEQAVYECPECKKDGESILEKAPAPAVLIPHSMVSPSAAAYIMYAKNVNFLPYYRQEKDWEQLGVILHRGTMANWANTCAMEYLAPLYEELKDALLAQKVIHADETTCQVLHEEGKTPQSKSYIWVYTSGSYEDKQITIYEYRPGRNGKYALDFLDGFHGRYVHTDGFSGYNKMTAIRCGCWAHMRRYLFEAIPRNRKKTGNAPPPAVKGFEYCNKLFKIDAGLKDLSSEERKEKRLALERPVLDQFWKWVDGMDCLGGSKLAKAITYARNQKKYLENYLLDGDCSLSNNAAERCVKNYVMERKNSLFHDTVDGAEATAIILSLTTTAKAYNLDIRLYLETVLQKMLDYKTEPAGILPELMPWSEGIQSICALKKTKK